MTMPPPGPQVPPVHHIWTAGPSDRRHFTWLSTRRALTQWRLWLIVVIVVGFAAAGAGSVPAAIGIAVVSLTFFLAMIAAMAWFRSYRTLGHTMFPGAHWASGFDDSGFMVANPGGTVTIGWASVVAVRPTADMVMFRTKTSRFGVPSPLVPPPAVEYAKGQIARHRPPPRP